MAVLGRYCCKSRKSPSDNFPAARQSDRRPSIFVVSIALPRSTVSLPAGDEVPRISTRKSRPRPGEFLIRSAKGLLQQYPPESGHRTWRTELLLGAKSCHVRGGKIGRL